MATRTNAFLRVPTGRRSNWYRVSRAHLLGARLHISHGNHREIPISVSIGIYGHLPGDTYRTRSEELNVGYLKYLCLPTKTRE